MNLSNYYWHFPAALTPKFCDDVIAYANQQEEVMAEQVVMEIKNYLKKKLKI